jgi:hypothetical protein
MFRFAFSWNDTSDYPPGPSDGLAPFSLPPPLQQPPPQFGNMGPPMDMDPGVISLQELQRQATAVVAFGNVFPVIGGSNLYMAVLSGEGAVKDVLRTEFLL